jgi:hypothetical protein
MPFAFNPSMALNIWPGMASTSLRASSVSLSLGSTDLPHDFRGPFATIDRDVQALRLIVTLIKRDEEWRVNRARDPVQREADLAVCPRDGRRQPSGKQNAKREAADARYSAMHRSPASRAVLARSIQPSNLPYAVRVDPAPKDRVRA